jgi:hypothetical protein
MSLKRDELLKDMKESIGTKDPIEFFAKLTDVFTLVFDRLDQLEKQNHRLQTYAALAIQWEPRVAADLLAKQIEILRQDKDTYFVELTALKRAYGEDRVTQNYHDFCQFWLDTLGWHPFLDYTK